MREVMNQILMRKSGVLYVDLVLGSASALGQNPIVFVAPAGTTIPNPGGTITATGGEVLTLEVWVQDIPDGIGNRLKEFQATMPCTASGGTSGSIAYPAELIPTVNDGYDTTTADPDYVFLGLTRGAWGHRAGFCDLNQLDNFPSVLRGVLPVEAVAPPAAKYMATFTYNVSADAQGTFTIQPAAPVEPTCPPNFGSFLKGMKSIAPATCYTPTYTALTINVPTVVPAVSEWGMAALGLLLLTGITLKYGSRRTAPM